MAYNYICLYFLFAFQLSERLLSHTKGFFIHRRFERELKIILLHFKSSEVGKNKEANQLLLL